MTEEHLATTFDPTIPTRTAALQSWLSMKTWVMVWLWYLNVLYWVGFAFLPQSEAHWALVSYAAIAPIVMVMMTRQRGLTRLSGLIHLPWLAFTVYLGLRLFSDVLGPAVSAEQQGVAYLVWLQVVFWSTGVCVVLDVVDVVRWFRGERYVLGTPAAHGVGASKLAGVFGKE